MAWSLLDRSGSLLGWSLGCSGGIFASGALGALWGRSLRAWAAFWRPLRRLAVLKQCMRTNKKRTISRPPKCRIMASFGIRVGPILGHFGHHLGVQKACSFWKILHFVDIIVIDKDKRSKRVLDRTWPNLVAKRLEHDFKMLPQQTPNQ